MLSVLSTNSKMGVVESEVKQSWRGRMPDKRKTKGRRQVVKEQYYRLEIVDSELHYSFEAGNWLHEDEAVSEHAAIEIDARLLSPKKHRDKVIQMRLHASRGVRQGSVRHPAAVEGTATGGQRNGYTDCQ
jgi:hypothetical protein